MREIVWTEEKIKKLWDFYSRDSGNKNQYFSLNYGRDIIRFVRKYINLKRIKHILDFGCGPGYLMRYLFDCCSGKVHGLDFSSDSIDEVNKNFCVHPRFAGAVCVENLPSAFKDNSMDLIFSIEVVEHLSDRQLEDTLQEIYRLLLPEGYIVITTPNKENLEANKTMCPECGCVFHLWQHIRSWEAGSLRDTMEKYGFHTVQCKALESFHPPRYHFLKELYRFCTHTRAEFLPFLVYIGKKST